MPDPIRFNLATLGQLQAPANPGIGWVGPERPAESWADVKADPLSALFDIGRGAVTGDAPSGMNLQGLGALLSAAVPVVGGVKGTLAELAGAGPGLFSRVDAAVAQLPAKGAHPNKILSILKSNASAEELAYRQVPEFLASKGNATVTPAEMAAHLADHPAPMPTVKTLRGSPMSQNLERRAHEYLGRPPNTADDYVRVGRQLEGEAQQFQRRHQDELARQYFDLSDEATRLAEDVDTHTGSTAGTPQYRAYQLPGGENYRETLLTLPQQPHNTYDGFVTQMEKKYGQGYDTERLTPAEQATQGRLWAEAQQPGGMTNQTFRGSHFSDTPNILAHTRSNERTLPTGERGHFIEEVQSDWHQTGKQKGYQGQINPDWRIVPISEWEKAPRGATEGFVVLDKDGNSALGVYGRNLPTRESAEQAAIKSGEGRVPDAPFKENWPDLALKQHLLDAAADPKAEWLGVSSADTQIQRWGSERLQWKPNQNQSDVLGRPAWEVTYESQVGGDALAGQGIADMGAEATARGHIKPETKLVTSEEQLANVIGDKTKAAKAWKRMQGAPDGGSYLPRAEGFRQQYDQNLKNKLQSLVKPFGGTVEPTPVVRPKADINRDIDAVLARNPDAMTAEESARYQALQRERNAAQKDQPVISWVVRLSPEMKAKILKSGLPLMALPLAVSHEQKKGTISSLGNNVVQQ